MFTLYVNIDFYYTIWKREGGNTLEVVLKRSTRKKEHETAWPVRFYNLKAPHLVLRAWSKLYDPQFIKTYSQY